MCVSTYPLREKTETPATLTGLVKHALLHSLLKTIFHFPAYTVEFIDLFNKKKNYTQLNIVFMHFLSILIGIIGKHIKRIILKYL